MRDSIQRVGNAIDGVSVLLDEAAHRAEALVVALLESRQLILQRLHLGLQLHHIFVGAEGSRGKAQRETDGVSDETMECDFHGLLEILEPL